MNAKSPDHAARRAVAWLYGCTLALSVAQGVILPAIPELARRFALSPGTAVQVVTAFAAGRLLGALPSGFLVDALGAKATLVLGSTLSLLSAAALTWGLRFWLIFLAQLLGGAGAALWTLGREIASLGLVEPGQRGRLLSGFFGFQMAGMSLGPVVAGVLLDQAGLRAAFGFGLVLALGVWVTTWWTHPHTPPPPEIPLHRPPEEGREGRTYRTAFALVTFSSFVMSLYRASQQSLLPVYVGAELGKSATAVGGLFGILSASLLLMILPAGWLLDTLGRKWGAVPAAVIPGLVFLVFPSAREMPELSVLTALLGIAGGFSLGSMAAWSYDLIPPSAWGRLQAIRRFFGELGSLVGPAVIGVLVDAYGAPVAFRVLAPVLLGTGLLLAFGVPETVRARTGRSR